MKASTWAIAAIFLAFSSASTAVVAANISLSHYEPLQRLTVRSITSSEANGNRTVDAAAPLELRFDALGRSYDLRLEPNSRIKAPINGIAAYRGEIAGVRGSWARIVFFEGVPRGLIYDGNELIAIEVPGDSLVATDAPVVYRLADAVVAPGSMSCGFHSLAMNGAQAAESLIGELNNLTRGPGAIQEIEVGVVADFEFTDARGGDAQAAAAVTNRMNNVDGIFSSQLGIQISVQLIETNSNPADPFTDTGSASDLLDELSNYRSATPAQNSNGLTHLWTGRDLDGLTVGIAWNGALCSNFFGAGLSEGNDSATFDALIAAHEIGHNFGAPHDGEMGSPCEAETGSFLMTPQLNGSDQFSQCSIDEMTPVIAGASCITALPATDVEVSLTSSTTILFGADTTLNYDVSNNGTIDATNVVADFTLPANVQLNSATANQGTCTSGAGTVSCAIGTIPGLTMRTVDISVTPLSLGPGALNASVTADADERPANNVEALQVSVDPAVDLVVGTPTGSTIRLNQSTSITATLENRATLDATGVTLTVDVGNALQLTAASWPLGSCTVLAQRVTCQAATFPAQSNSSVSVTATGISAGNPNITASLAANEADLVPGDNSANGRVRVNDPDDDDDGGGSAGPLFLALLAAAIVARCRRRRIS